MTRLVKCEDDLHGSQRGGLTLFQILATLLKVMIYIRLSLKTLWFRTDSSLNRPSNFVYFLKPKRCEQTLNGQLYNNSEKVFLKTIKINYNTKQMRFSKKCVI